MVSHRIVMDSLILACRYVGVHLTLFFICYAALWGKRTKSPKPTYGMLAYTTVIQDTLGSTAQMRILAGIYR